MAISASSPGDLVAALAQIRGMKREILRREVLDAVRIDLLATTLLDYEPDQRAAFWRLVDKAAELMQTVLSPQGINMGVNQGSAAGAGVPEHLHAHLVPRWTADTNFITVIGEVRVVPDSLEEMRKVYMRAAGELGLA